MHPYFWQSNLSRIDIQHASSHSKPPSASLCFLDHTPHRSGSRMAPGSHSSLMSPCFLSPLTCAQATTVESHPPFSSGTTVPLAWEPLLPWRKGVQGWKTVPGNSLGCHSRSLSLQLSRSPLSLSGSLNRKRVLSSFCLPEQVGPERFQVRNPPIPCRCSVDGNEMKYLRWLNSFWVCFSRLLGISGYRRLMFKLSNALPDARETSLPLRPPTPPPCRGRGGTQSFCSSQSPRAAILTDSTLPAERASASSSFTVSRLAPSRTAVSLESTFISLPLSSPSLIFLIIMNGLFEECGHYSFLR